MNYIDLFAGASGASEGFIRAGFNPIAHVEMDTNACNTIKTRLAYRYLKNTNKINNYRNYLLGHISREQLYNEVPVDLLDSVLNVEISDRTLPGIFINLDRLIDSKKINLIIGGPPCQAYSLVGRGRDPNSMRWDRRNFLFRYYAAFLKRYKPELFIFENVLGLLSAGNKKHLKAMLDLFSEIGYSTDYQILNADEYGVLQKRKRVVIIGRRGRTIFHFPELSMAVNNWQTKRHLFYDLPSLVPGQEMHVAKYSNDSNEYLRDAKIRNGMDFTTQHITRIHNEKDLAIYAIAIKKWIDEKQRLKYPDLPKRLRTHNNTVAFLNRFKVIDPYGCSHTIVAHIAKDGHYYIYPDLKQVRSISVREAARIQSFPDDYFFEGGRTAAFKQIGNAVPPLMAENLANVVRNLI